MNGVGQRAFRDRFAGRLSANRRSVASVLTLTVAAGLGAAGSGAETAGGTLRGTVSLEGRAPKSRPLDLSSDPNCLEIAGKKVRRGELVVGRTGGVANVFVRLEGAALAAAAGPVPAEPVVIEQRGCIYHPRMAGARKGQTLRVVNHDDFAHNVRSVSTAGSDFNIGQAFAGLEFDYVLAAEEPMLRLRCDMHTWMFAFVGVVDHPWFAVTGEDGRFEMTGVPVGSYELVAWHEELGIERRVVAVEAGGEVSVEIALPAGAGG